MSLSDQLRQLILDQWATPNHIARVALIDKSAMSRFMKGGSLTLHNLDKLARVLGVQLYATKTVPPALLGRPKS
jgi:DNA-binding Xre family transcriptional regulator